MNTVIWVIVALKIFLVCWLIYILTERLKRKQQQNVVIIEEGPAPAAYAGAPVTQLPKDCQEFYNQQLYASPNMMPPPETNTMDQRPSSEAVARRVSFSLAMHPSYTLTCTIFAQQHQH
ncbi:uncharacterized protein LOC106091770 isoform X1 [Stomoxys calcitrans]|uniref:uncharacterized protein LOC106091770 isoform X1 n=1 Tax=Stomoxys calcitrans TaxID=35570 RepID=UPI0027E357EB|nr:uncharacterized protein LOC106091770 isoform X1 [Stomoxys calcitrans]